MAERRFYLVDVFGSGPISGNPLAVVVDSEGLSAEQMQGLTRWLGYSETTFLAPPRKEGADYSVRIFTLSHELPFAGHPTLGSAHVWSQVNGIEKNHLVQECGIGLVDLRVGAGRFAFAAPPLLRDGPVDPAELEEFCAVLGVAPSDVVAAKWVSNGPGWVGVELADPNQVLDLKPDLSKYGLEDIFAVGVLARYPEGHEVAYEVRAFFDDGSGRILEDPVTGSLNASLAQWMIDTDKVTPPYVAAQGTALGRNGRVHVDVADGEVWIGGSAVTLVEGTLDF